MPVHTLRTNLHTGEKDPRMELAVLKTIAGLLNSLGRALVVGVANDGSAVGIENDGFPNEDRLTLHLINLLEDRMGGWHAVNITRTSTITKASACWLLR
ncbi:MAG: ATP-binding protein [Hyphomonadaceae bacterium]